MSRDMLRGVKTRAENLHRSDRSQEPLYRREDSSLHRSHLA